MIGAVAGSGIFERIGIDAGTADSVGKRVRGLHIWCLGLNAGTGLSEGAGLIEYVLGVLGSDHGGVEKGSLKVSCR